ncbi:hypothetical protein TcWFU_010205 [Taenia crassiceps]|uniref:Uncharacterized protein n=1 Tax=Taenia crassiceps TaxID=6207 RepID=A0ABR4QN79_9CEST
MTAPRKETNDAHNPLAHYSEADQAWLDADTFESETTFDEFSIDPCQFLADQINHYLPIRVSRHIMHEFAHRYDFGHLNDYRYVAIEKQPAKSEVIGHASSSVMHFLRHHPVLTSVSRVIQAKVFRFSGKQSGLLLPTPALTSAQYTVYPTLGNREERPSINGDDVSNAFMQLQSAERNRLNIRIMDAAHQRTYFNDLWSKITADKAVKASTIARFLHLKYEFGQEFSYESALADLKRLGLKPDAIFFSVFIRRSCERGDMEETSFYLKAMHQEGAVPNDYIFSKILHGYVKCGLPDEVATTQDVMSKLNYWPSMMATEDLLTAYADLGDGNGVIELLQENLNRSESLLNRPVFSPRFLADLYARLAVAPHFDTNEQAASMILGLLKKRPPYFDDFRLGIALTRLLKSGYVDAAFQFLRGTRPHTFSPSFLSKIPELLAEQDPEVLNDFWLSSGAFGRLPEVIRIMSNETALQTLRANPPLRTELCNAVANAVVLKAVKDKNVDLVVEFGRVLGRQRFHLLYLIVVPRLLSLGLAPAEVLAKFEDPLLKSCAALGIVLNELCALPSFLNPPVPGSSIENAEKFIVQFQNENLLPFTQYLSVNNNFIHLLLRGCAKHTTQRSDDSGVDQAKLDAWTRTLFSCFAADRYPLLASALLRFCGQSTVDVTDSTIPRFASLDEQTRRALANAFVVYFNSQKIPISYLDSVKKTLKELRLPNEAIATLISAGIASKHTTLVNQLKAGEIEEVIIELEQMQKSISQETSPLGHPSQYSVDLLGEALAVSSASTGADAVEEALPTLRFTPKQLEDLYWALISVAGLKSPAFSATKIGEQYLNASDMDGLVVFLNKMADRYPQYLSILLSHWFINKFVQLDAVGAGQAMEEILRKNNSRKENTPTLVLGAKLLSKRLEPFNHLRKVRNVHTAVEELCQNHQLFAAYALRDWACRIGLTLLPQTTEVLLASKVFGDSVPRIPADLLNPDRLALRGGISINPLIPRLQEIIASLDSAMEEETATSVLSAIDAAAAAIADHPFVTDPSVVAQSLRPSVLKKTQFTFWSLVHQVIDSPGSRLSIPGNLALLAGKLVAAGHETAVLAWISCLLRKDIIAALCCGGLASPNAKFVELLHCRPDLQYAVATSPALASLTSEQKGTVAKAFSALKRPYLPTLALALSDKNFERAYHIIGELGDEAIPVLANFANSQFNYVSLIAEVMKEKPLEAKIAFVNGTLDVAKTYKAPLRLIFSLLEMAAKPNMREEENVDYDCLKDRLSISNQVFLRTFFKLRTTNRVITAGYATGTEYFESIFPGAAHIALRDSVVKDTRLGKSQALYETLLSIQKSYPSKLQAAVESVILSQFLMSGHRNVVAILFSAAHQRNAELLDACAGAALPFLHNALGVAFKGLAEIYRQHEVDPVIHEAISFHRLGEFTVPVAQPRDVPKIESLSLKFDKPTGGDVSDPVRLAKESITHLADTLANNKLSAENARILVDVVRKLWGPGRIDLLLCHLVEMQASESVDQVIGSLPLELRERRLPFKTLSRLVKLNATGDAFNNEQFNEAVDVLKTSPPQSVTLCMNGPHVAAMFATWPESLINEAMAIIDNTLGRSQPLLRLQLAAALVHRGLVDKAAPITEMVGPLPFNYLAGSLSHPLNKSAFHNSFQYLKQLDPEHVPAFVDASLRNAAMSARSTASTETVIELVKAALEEAPAELKTYCQPSTMRLLRDATKQSKEIQQALFTEPATENKN